MDLFKKIDQYMGPLGQYASFAHGYYAFPKIEGELSSRMMFRGKEKVMWSINNYLGLGNHPAIRKVDGDAAKEWGLAYPMGARIMSGNTKYHEQLEDECAEFVQKEAGLLVNFGYQGILSVIDALLGRNDVVVYDSESHACIVDGVRLHLGKRFAFEHNNIASLDKNLARAQKVIEKTGGGIMVISEGVFGMRGDQGLLREIVALKSKYEFRLMVDDAHGFGVLGETGAGTGEHQGVQDEIDLYFATFAKSMASVGAFFAGPRQVIEFLRYNTRSQVFAKSLPMPTTIGAIKRLEMLKTMPELRENLWKNVNMLQEGLKTRGYDIGDTNSCVTPVYLKGSVEEASQLVFDLRENFNIFCSPVMYPVIPKGMLILRLIPTSYHTERDVEETLDAFDAVSHKLYNGLYAQEMAITPK
jgi:glycine C-acetyltransferase